MYQFTPFVVPFLLALAVVGVLAGMLAKADDSRPNRLLLLWALATGVWCLAETVRLSATTGSLESFGHNLRFLGTALSSLAGFLLAAAYTGRSHWFRRRRLFWLSLLPVLTNVLVWTNPYHGLIRAPIDPAAASAPVVEVAYGPWYLVHAVYSYLLVGLASIWLLDEFDRAPRHGVYRRQLVFITLAIMAPLIPTILFQTGTTTIDLTPLGSTATAVFLTLALLRYQLLDLTPIARDVVLETIDNGVVVLDATGHIVDANERATTLLECEYTTLVGESLETATAEVPLLEAITATGTVSIDRGDETRYIESEHSPITVDGGQAAGTVIIFSDVTETVCRKQAIEESERRYRALAEHFPDGVVALFNADLEWTLIGGELAAELGEGTQEGQTVAAFHTESEFTRFRSGYVSVFDGERREFQFSRGGRTVKTRLIPVTDEAGAVRFGLAVFVDITETKTREAELDLLKQVLSRVFRHNVRNELTVLNGHASLIEEHVDEPLTDHVTTIQQTVEQLLSHSEKAKDLERIIDTDQTDIRQALGPIVERSIEQYAAAYPTVTIENTVSDSLFVSAHPAIEKAIAELIENAIVHHDGETQLHIRLSATASSEEVTLVIEDNGTGISTAETTSLETGEETALEHGSGVGLWVVSWATERSGGELSIDTETALGGTRVQVRLPAADPRTTAVDDQSTAGVNDPVSR